MISTARKGRKPKLRWSSQQIDALDTIHEWLNGSPSFFRGGNAGTGKLNRADPERPSFYCAGYAGTGKTTLAQEIARRVDGDVVFAAFTGKAAAVMRQKGCIGADTIDHLIYRPKIQIECARDKVCDNPVTCERCYFRRERFVGRELNPDSEVAQASLAIIDECSMVDEDMAHDLLSFGTPVLVLGDPAQLPPVFGRGYFTNRQPDIMLTEVHRQALDSPIIELATRVRCGKACRPGRYGDSAVIGNISVADMLEHDQIIVGTHRKRHFINSRCRRHLGFRTALPDVGEKLLCLKNDRRLGLRNGTLWTVVETTAVGDDYIDLIVRDDDGQEVAVSAPIEGFELVRQQRCRFARPAVRVRLRHHLPQGAGIAMGVRSSIRRKPRVPP